MPLDTPYESDESKYISPKTLWNLRDLGMSHNLEKVLFTQTTNTLAKAFQVGTSKQRLDSVHVCSNMKCLGRIGIFIRSIHTFLVNPNGSKEKSSRRWIRSSLTGIYRRRLCRVFPW